jgi:hypothetical protein
MDTSLSNRLLATAVACSLLLQSCGSGLRTVTEGPALEQDHPTTADHVQTSGEALSPGALVLAPSHTSARFSGASGSIPLTELVAAVVPSYPRVFMGPFTASSGERVLLRQQQGQWQALLQGGAGAVVHGRPLPVVSSGDIEAFLKALQVQDAWSSRSRIHVLYVPPTPLASSTPCVYVGKLGLLGGAPTQQAKRPPRGHEGRQEAGERVKLAEKRAKLAEERARLAEAKKQATEECAKLAEAEKQAAEERAKLAEAEKRATEERAKLAEAEKQAAEERAKLAEAEKQAAEERAKEYAKLVEKEKQLAEAEKLAAEERAKLAEAEKQAAEERAKLAEAEKLAAEERAKLAEAEKQATEEHAKLAEEELAKLKCGYAEQLALAEREKASFKSAYEDLLSKQQTGQKRPRLALKGEVVCLAAQQTGGQALLSQTLISAMSFGAKEWEKYFGKVGTEPALPSGIDDILNSTCPFWPGKQVKDTHLLVLMPSKVNGKPFSVDLLSELVQHPQGGGHATKYRYYGDSIKKQFGTRSFRGSYWVLMTRDVLEGSRDEKYASQKSLVATHAKRTGLPYAIPGALEAATAILSHYVRSGERLYTDDPWTWTRCQELVDGQYPTIVGGFSSGGLDVNYYGHDDGYSGCGVAGLRKL